VYVPDREPSASNWFYPARSRCLACRKYFGFLVIKRLWCSYDCAGMPAPSADPADWPREHRTRAGEAKVSYHHPEEVNAAQHEHETIHLYLCSYCGTYHLGHRQTGEAS
jgi:hypothetical protein